MRKEEGKHFKENEELLNNEVDNEIVQEHSNDTINDELSQEDSYQEKIEMRDKIIELERINQNLSEQIKQSQELINNKDELINNLTAQVNLYVTKYNKDEITIDALQSKILSMLSNN